MTNGLFDLATIILLAAVLGVIAKLLKQPTVLAYLITGAVIGSYSLLNLSDRETWQIFADLGIMFLLFMVGLEINYTSLRLVGKDSVIIGLGQVVFTFILGFFIAQAFQFGLLASSYIAIALTFSSTIIVVKLLSEKRALASLYGKISIGILLIQDFIIIILLVVLAGVETGSGFIIGDVALILIKGVILFVLMIWLGRKIIPKIFDAIAGTPELLFLISLAWVFVVVSLVYKIGFSVEIGGFLAGLALANSAENWQIASRIKTLRDFFILIFFAVLGSSLIFSSFSGIAAPIIIFSLFVLLGNPLIVLIIMGLMGYRKRTSFLAGVTIAQISEFSLVLAALGLKLGHIGEAEMALITAVGVITITFSTYLIIYAEKIYHHLVPVLSLFERRYVKEPTGLTKRWRKPIILIGCRRIGQSIAAMLHKKDVLIIDFNPDIIEQLQQCGYDYIFGDMADPDIIEHANFQDARLIISTAPTFEDNLALLEKLHMLKSRGKSESKIIVRAEDEHDAEMLYKMGADYVLLPHFISGHYLGKTIARNKSLQFLFNLKMRDKQLMKKDQCWLLE